MTGPFPMRLRIPALIALLAAAIGMAATDQGAGDDAPRPPEVRGLWVLRSSMTSPDRIATLVATARRHGFSALLVQVRGRGDAYFSSTLEPRATALAAQPTSFDPLAEVIAAARTAGLQVHAWVVVNLVSSAAELPTSRQHVIHRHPEWLMIPRGLAQQMTRIDPRSPAYVGTLARWARTQSTQVEGLYLSPIHPDAAAYTTDVLRDLVLRYPVDGLHLDYIRYPTAAFDYSPTALAEFRAEVAPGLVSAQRTRLDARVPIDPFAYADAEPERWRTFRQARVTALVQRIRTAVTSVRPEVTLSAAIVPDLEDAQQHRLQDWRTWLELGLLDVVCPMAYTTDAALFARQIASVATFAGTRPVWAGIGAYRLAASDTVSKIDAARRLGARGVVLFSYDSLIDRSQGDDYLARVSREAFTSPRQTDGSDP